MPTLPQAHLRQQYADTRPLFDMLLQAYPRFLKAEWFDYESYLWAAELFYSYAFEISFPGEEAEGGGSGRPAKGGSQSAAAKGGKPGRKGKAGGASSGRGGGKGSGSAAGGEGGGGDSDSSKTVMVPFSCFINHSPWPHCVR